MPGYFIQEYRGTQALGYYSSIAYLITMGEMINISLGQSIIPRLSRYYAAGQKGSFFRTLVIIIAASTGIGIAGLVIVTGAGPLILSIIYTRDYAPYWNILMLLMIAACFQYIGGSLSNALSSARKFNYLPALYGIVTAINIVFLMVLVPSKGLEGAAYAVIVSSYAHLFGNLLVNIFTL
jgi:O-antigen/teichoic acid export membrane protein